MPHRHLRGCLARGSPCRQGLPCSRGVALSGQLYIIKFTAPAWRARTSGAGHARTTGRRDSPVRTSTDRILTTHTGSIARPDDLIELMRAKENGLPYDTGAFEARAAAAVADCVRRQLAA